MGHQLRKDEMPTVNEDARLATSRDERYPAAGTDIIELINDGIDRSSRTPRYEQVIRLIAEAIHDGRLPPGAALPPEPELAGRVGLSRRTIREAWNDLAHRGLIVRRRGIGTFIARPAIEQPLGRLSSFIHTLASGGSPPDVTLLGVRLTTDREASPLLTGARDGVVFEISRLFRTDEEPVVLETIFLPVEIGQRLPGDQLAVAVIDDLLESEAGVVVDGGEEVLRLTRLRRADAALLQATPGDPAFLVVRSGFSVGRTIEVRRSVIRGERAQFRITLHGRGGSSFSQPEAIAASTPDA